MNVWVLVVIVALWVVFAAVVIILFPRMVNRADEASEMDSMTREVRRLDSAGSTSEQVDLAPVPIRTSWGAPESR